LVRAAGGRLTSPSPRSIRSVAPDVMVARRGRGRRRLRKWALGRIQYHASPLWTLQRLCFGPDVAADPSDRGENHDPGTATKGRKRLLTKEARLENGPSDARGKVRILTGGSIAIMCPASDGRGTMTAGPDGVRDPAPNTKAALTSRCTKRVLWIVGSTDRHLILLFHPGTNARLRRSSVDTGKPPRASS
jgi:hypothetical protein